MKKFKENQAGFTLAELLVVIAILGIIILGVTTLYLGQLKLTDNEINVTDAQAKLGAALDTIYARGSSANNILAAATVNSTVYTSDAGTTILTLPSVDSSDNIIPGQNDTVVFTTQNNQIIMDTEPAVNSRRQAGIRILSNAPTALTFEYENPLSIADSTWFKAKAAKQVKTSVGVRDINLEIRVTLQNKQ